MQSDPPHAIAIRDFDDATDLERCSRWMAESEPWITLRRDYDACRAVLGGPCKEKYVASHGGEPTGFLVLNMSGAFVGYIQTVCVAPGLRGLGIGTRLVRFAEERIFRDSPNVFLCVSSFNLKALKLYRRLGYEKVGELKGYLVREHSELLLRKSIGPISAFRRDARAQI